jgi:hypothetical protein
MAQAETNQTKENDVDYKNTCAIASQANPWPYLQAMFLLKSVEFKTAFITSMPMLMLWTLLSVLYACRLQLSIFGIAFTLGETKCCTLTDITIATILCECTPKIKIVELQLP